MTSKICGNCVHYMSGQLENPCAKNPKYVGYLREGCGSWSETEEEYRIIKTRVCNKCGKELPMIMFTRNSFLCKNCKPTTKPSRRRRNGTRDKQKR